MREFISTYVVLENLNLGFEKKRLVVGILLEKKSKKMIWDN